MTTTVTLKTHDWPVKVTTTDHFVGEDYSHDGVTVQTVHPHKSVDFHITNTRSIAFDELPVPVAPAPETEA